MSKTLPHRTFWRLAGPMMISNVSIATLGLVDTAVVGHLEQAYFLAAIAIGAIVFDFIYWSLGFLRMGTTSLTAQADGTANQNEVILVLQRVILLALFIAVIFMLCKSIVIDTGIGLLKGSDIAKEYAKQYCHIVILSLPAVLVTLSISGWLLGLHDAIATLKIALLINVINIVLDIIFVVYLEQGVYGVAYATVIANYIGVLFASYLAYKKIHNKNLTLKLKQTFVWQKIKELFVFNRDIFIRTLCILFTFAFFIRESGSMGDVMLAANSILIKFQIFMALSLDGYAQAAEVMVGNAIAAKKRKDFVNALTLVFNWGLGTSVLFCLGYLFFHEHIIALLTNIQAVIMLANEYAVWVIFLPLVSVWSFILDGIFIGAGRAKEMRNNMLLSTFGVFLPIWYFTQDLGNTALWLAFIAFMLCRGLGLAYKFIYLDRSNQFVARVS